MHKTFIKANIGTENYTTTITNDRHTGIIDEPTDIGGLDKGMRPTEHLVAALCSCTAITLKMYLDNKKVAVEDIQVEGELLREETGNRIARKVTIVPAVEEKLRKRVLAIADKCTVHKLLKDAFFIETTLI